MTGYTGFLLALGLVAVIAGIVWLTARRRVNAFLVLILASFVFGAYASIVEVGTGVRALSTDALGRQVLCRARDVLLRRGGFRSTRDGLLRRGVRRRA